MRKFFILLLFLSFNWSAAQSLTFAWITDSHVGYNKADADLDSIVISINSNNKIKFIVHTGDITEKGKNAELERAKEILDKLNSPYYIVPGNHDAKWSESGGTKFSELWDDDRFSFAKDNYRFIGINSAILWKGGGGHFSPETLDWLREEIQSVKGNEKIILLAHHPLNEEIDNWFEATNILREKKIAAVLVGHGHEYKIFDFDGIPGIAGRSAYSRKDTSWAYSLCRIKDDSLFVYEVTRSDSARLVAALDLNAERTIEKIDSSQFNDYDSGIVWKKDLHTSFVTEPLVLKDKIITAGYNGFVQCFSAEGKLLWDFDAFGNIASTPAEKDGYLTIATLQGDLHTLNVNTGEQIQSIGFDEPITSDLLMIDYEGTKDLMIPKQTGSKAAVVFGTASGKVICYDVETLQEYWTNNSAKGMIEIKPLRLGNKIIYGAWDSYLYCIDSREGWLIWKWREDKSFYYSPAAVEPVTDGKSIYITSPLKHTMKIDPMLGKTIWKSDKYDVWESIGITSNGKRLLLKGMNGKFYNPYTKHGKGGLTYKIGYNFDVMPSTPIENKGVYLFTTKEGSVYRIYKRKYKKILFLGTARMFNIHLMGNDKYFVSNMDGSIAVFKYSEKTKK